VKTVLTCELGGDTWREAAVVVEERRVDGGAVMDQFARFLDSGAAAALAGSSPAPQREAYEAEELSGELSGLGLGPPPGFYASAAPVSMRARFDSQRPSPIFAPGASRDRRRKELTSPASPRSPRSPKTAPAAMTTTSAAAKARSSTASHRLIKDLHDWLCRRPEHARHIGTTTSDDGGATFSEFYSEFPHHAAKRKCKGSGIKAVVEAHGAGFLEWVDAGSCGMGRIQVVKGSAPRRPLSSRRSPPSPPSPAHVVLDDSCLGQDPPVARGPRPALTVSTSLVRHFEADPRPVHYAKLCKYAGSCPFGDRCRYAHTPAELEAARLRRRESLVSSPVASPGTPATAPARQHWSAAEAERDHQLRLVLDDAGLEEKWLPHLRAHELDKEALVLCDEQDLDRLDLPLGARVKLRRWCERERDTRRRRLWNAAANVVAAGAAAAHDDPAGSSTEVSPPPLAAPNHRSFAAPRDFPPDDAPPKN